MLEKLFYRGVKAGQKLLQPIAKKMTYILIAHDVQRTRLKKLGIVLARSKLVWHQRPIQ
jgi:hypothetical protein